MAEQKRKPRNLKLPVDWEAVKAHWLQNGRDYKLTGDAFGIKSNTIVKRFSREGMKGKAMTTAAALKKFNMAKQELAEVAAVERPEIRVSPIDAFTNQKESFKANMSQAMAKASEYIGTLPGDAILQESRKVESVMATGSKLYGFGDDGTKAALSVNILNLTADSLTPSSQVIDAQ
jgi:hypothetical protein